MHPFGDLQGGVKLSAGNVDFMKSRRGVKNKGPFITQVMSGPKEFLVGDEEELRAIG
jgi:hypothetical protein